MGSKSTIKTVERRQWRRSGVFIVNFEQVNVSWAVAIPKVRQLERGERVDKKNYKK